jgi:hypothetical protein
MQWIRKNRSVGSLAALFALSIQLVLSFGHIHPKDIQGTRSPVTASPQSQNTGGDGTAPANNDSDTGHDYCAICAALRLTSNSVIPTVALIATPISHSHRWLSDFNVAQISFELHSLFQARAPPRSI